LLTELFMKSIGPYLEDVLVSPYTWYTPGTRSAVSIDT